MAGFLHTRPLVSSSYRTAFDRRNLSANQPLFLRNGTAAIVPVVTQHYPMLQRNLLYTGVTRGKRLVVLVGQKKAIAIAVRNVSGRRRWSKLDEWLRLSAPLPIVEIIEG